MAEQWTTEIWLCETYRHAMLRARRYLRQAGRTDLLGSHSFDRLRVADAVRRRVVDADGGLVQCRTWLIAKVGCCADPLPQGPSRSPGGVKFID